MFLDLIDERDEILHMFSKNYNKEKMKMMSLGQVMGWRVWKLQTQYPNQFRSGSIILYPNKPKYLTQLEYFLLDWFGFI